MEMNETLIDIIDLDLEDLELVKKVTGGDGYPFPTISVGKVTCFLNKKAVPYVPEAFKWYVNDEWCVLKRCGKNEKNAYVPWQAKSTGMICRLPAQLEGAPTYRGTHKLYKTKDGVAFKKSEFIE